jgi:type IV secretory pathway TrbF-like protein
LHESQKPLQDYQAVNIPENRYQNAKQEWDERIGSARVQAANWRIIAFLTMFVCIFLTLGIIYIGSQNKVRPYIVRVNADGSARTEGPISPNYRPQTAEIKYFLSQFVQNTQTIPLDPVVAGKNWKNAYSYLRPAAAAKMNNILQSDNPMAKIGIETHEAEVTVVAPVSQNTYQVRWKVTVYNKEGTIIDQYRMTGMFTIDLITPKNEKILAVNPLGIFIKDFNFAKEM